MNKEVGKKLQSYTRKWQGRRRKATQKASSLDSGRRSGESGKGQKKMKRMIMALELGALLLALTASVALAATRYGTNGDDLMYGTNGADQMYGRGGSDLMYGLAGDDLMYGGYGNDFVYGRDGDDNLYGRYGYDEISGGNGDDYINVKDGRRDRVWCGPGRDSFTVDSVDEVSGCEVPAI